MRALVRPGRQIFCAGWHFFVRNAGAASGYMVNSMSNETQSDDQLLREFAATGGNAPFSELVRRHSAMVLTVCGRVLNNHQEAQDVAQAVFLIMAKKAGRLVGEGSIAGWLHRVALFAARDACKARRRREAREEEGAKSMILEQTADGNDAETAAALHATLADLPDKYRLPLVLHYLEGQPYETVGARLGCGQSALAMRLSRGRELLRGRLARRGVALSVPVLAGLLTQEAAAGTVSEAFVAATAKMACGWVAAGGTAAAGAAVIPTPVAAAMKGAINMMFWSSVKTAALATVAAIAVGGAGVTAVVAVAKDQAKSAAQVAAAVPVAPAASGGLAEGSGAPPSRERTIYSGATTYEAARRDLFLAGVRVFELRRWRDEFPDANDHRADLVRPTPIEIRRKRMPLADYVQDLARNRGGEKVFWLRDGAVAILVKDVSNEEIAGLKEELASPDDAIRFMAAERAATFPTVPAVRLLIEITGDRNPAVAEAARRSLCYLGLGAALALDEKVWTWMEADLSKLRPPQIPWFELALAGGERILPTLRRAVAEQVQLKGSAFVAREKNFCDRAYLCEPITGSGDRYHPAVLALAVIPGPSAQNEIAALVQDNDSDVRRSAILALLYAGSVSGLAPLEKELRATSPEDAYRWGLALELAGTLDNERAKALLRQAVRETAKKALQACAARVLCATGDSNDLAFVKSVLTDKEYENAMAQSDGRDWTSVTNSCPVATLRGENLLANAKKALPSDRYGTASAVLLRINTPEARALLEERASNSSDDAWENFTAFARFSLAKTADERRAMIEKAVTGGGSRSAGQTYDYLSGNWGPRMQHARSALNDAYRVGIPNRPNLWPQMGGKKVQTACQADVRRWQNGDYHIWYANSLFATAYYLGGEEGLDVVAAALPACGRGSWRGTQKEDVQNQMANRNIGRGGSYGLLTAPLARLADGSGSATAQRAEALFLQALTNQDVNIRLAAVPSLPDLGNGMAWSLLERALADPDATIRWRAAASMPRLIQQQGVTEKTLPLLERTTDDKDPDVRYDAVKAFMVATRFLPKAMAEREREILKKRLSDTDAEVKSCAVSAMIFPNWPDDYRGVQSQVVQELLKHPDSGVRIAAMEAIRAPDPLLELYAKDADKRVRLVAAQRLWSQFRSDARVKEVLSAQKMEALFTEALADHDADVRSAAAVGFFWLQELPWEKIRDKLIARLAVETDIRVQPRIWRLLQSRPPDQFVEKAFQKYFLARLPVADMRELLQIKLSEEGRYPGDGLVLKAIKDREAALKAQGATELTPATGTGATPK